SAYPIVLDPQWTATGNMAHGHARYAPVVALPSGKVLAASGQQTTGADLFDPSTSTWAATGNLSVYRSWFGLALTGDGRVLAVGAGSGGGSAEIYDPATGKFT